MRNGNGEHSERTLTTGQSDGSRAGGQTSSSGRGSARTVVSVRARQAGRCAVRTSQTGTGRVGARQARSSPVRTSQAGSRRRSVVTIPITQVVRNLGRTRADRRRTGTGTGTGTDARARVSVMFSRFRGVYHIHQHQAKRRRNRGGGAGTHDPPIHSH